MAIFVVLATVAGIVIVAITTSGNEDLEASGSTDLGENCRPNEVRDPALESMGISGTHEHLDQYHSETIGCKPYCGTWEYFSKGQNANGEYEYDPDASLGATIGGPDGAGGVFSSNTGCFAPCYWSTTRSSWYPENGFAPFINGIGRIFFFDDNRNPAIKQVRLGVNYRRSTNPNPSALSGSRMGIPNVWMYSDLYPANTQFNADGKPYISADHRASWVGSDTGMKNAPGTKLHEDQINAGVPTIFIPNWRSANKETDDGRTGPNGRPDPGGVARNGLNPWMDENLEYRADPINKVCTIVNVTLDNKVVCSSEWDECLRNSAEYRDP